MHLNGSQPPAAVGTAYDDFLATLKREPSAAECEQWAIRHAGDPEEPRALVDAGWYTARAGNSEDALALFHRAVGFGGESGRDAQVGIIEQLYTLRRERDAETAQQALRAELEQPARLADLRIFEDMADMLCDAGKYEPALEWCQAGLDRAATAGDTTEVENYRHMLLITRGFLRDELGIECDDEDLAARAQANASLTAFRDMVRNKWGVTRSGIRS